MVKVEVIEKFDLKDFDKLSNIKRASSKEKEGSLYLGDTFECDENMADYLTGNNPLKRAVVKIIEIRSDKKEETKVICEDEEVEKLFEEKPKTKKTKKSKK